jgi:hypothetical protein
MGKTWDEMRGEIFDSRDIIERIEELESAITFSDDGEGIPAADTDPDDLAELSILRAIVEDAESEPDWQYGVGFIPEDKFEDYAQELAEDIGAIDRDAGWPLQHIDWSAAADALRMDYTEYEFDGVTYLAR